MRGHTTVVALNMMISLTFTYMKKIKLNLQVIDFVELVGQDKPTGSKWHSYLILPNMVKDGFTIVRLAAGR